MNKICPKCQGSHSKKGIFCSRKCSNSRTWSEEDRKKKSIAASNNPKVQRAAALGRLAAWGTSAICSTFIEKPCSICGTAVSITISYAKKRRNILCQSKECRAAFHSLSGRKSAISRKSLRRSLDEIKLFNLCKRHWNCEHNSLDYCGWDADILIPGHKTAILWNGPWHYKEMNMSNHSLCQVVNRDILKIIAFENIQWNILLYEDNKWSPETALIDIYLQINGRPTQTRTETMLSL